MRVVSRQGANSDHCSLSDQKKAIYWDTEYVKHLGMYVVRQLGFGLVGLLAAPLLGVLVPVFQFGYR